MFLHIGFHKTGTSAIQAFLFRNASRLQSRGYLLPRSGTSGPTHALLANSLKRANLLLDADAIYDALLSELRGGGVPNAIVTSECFLEGIDPLAVRRRLDRPWLDCRVVVYVRRQDIWIQSLFNEIVRDDARRYTGPIERMREVRHGMMDYHAVLQPWTAAFGRDRIIVRVFERGQMPSGLYADFLEAVGLTADDGWEVTDQIAARNPSLPAELLEFLRRCNRIPMLREEHAALVAGLREIAQRLAVEGAPAEHAWLCPRDRIAILRRFADGNASIARELLHRPDGVLFYDPEPDPEQSWRPPHLEADREHALFEMLPRSLQQMLERLWPPIRERRPGRPFLPVIPGDEVERLRAVIMRQRLELARLYAERTRA